MNQFEQPPGRFLEVIVGIITSLISLVFGLLLFILAQNSGFSYASLIGALLLLFAVYWFGLISYRLLLKRPNRNGGLFSVGGLKFLSVFVGLSTLAAVPLAVYMGHWGAVIGCLCMTVACAKGWKMAGRRGNV